MSISVYAQDIPFDEMLDAATVEGIYQNSRGDKASITTYITKEATLFEKAHFNIEVDYENNEGNTASINIDTQDLIFKDEDRPSFYASYRDDCDDPDCFNTDGEIKLIKNSRGTYTLYLEFEHYNNAPIEFGDEDDFSDRSFLKKMEQKDLTKKAWLEMDEATRDEIIDDLDYGYELLDKYKGYKVLEESPSNRSTFKYKNEVKELYSQAIDRVDAESIDQVLGSHTGYATVGEITKYAFILISADNKVLGGKVWLRQDGAQKEEPTSDDEYHYATLAEAEKNGFEDTDVSWSAEVEFIAVDTISENSDYYFEWSGH